MGFHLFLSHILWLLRKAAIKIMLVDRLKVIIPGGGTPIYGLYRYVPPDRVWFLRFPILK